MPLETPALLLDELPLAPEHADVVLRGRAEVAEILDGTDDRLLVVVGPCSVHDVDAALDYARRLAAKADELQDDLCLAMRVYFEKPRTTTGWKGMINDPHLDGSGDVNTGLRMARKLLLEVLGLGLPVGCEFLDPITPQYISDTVAWGAIGARTTESQIHRQLGSGLSMPVGFKNRTDGNVQVAVDAVRAAAAPHAFAGVDVTRHPGDPPHPRQPRLPRHPARRARRAQLHAPRASMPRLRALRAAGLPERLVIDASHDNSGKDHDRQPAAAADVAAQVAGGNRAIVGVMLESFLVAGRQELGGGALDLRPVDHRRVHGLGDHRRRCWRGLAAAVRDAAGALMRIAVLGVGLIGGSIGLAARERIDGAEVIGFGRSPERLARAAELGAIDRAAGSLEEALEGAERLLLLWPRSGRSREQIDGRAGGGTDRTAWSPTSARSSAAWWRRARRALRGRPPDRRGGDGGRRARARGPLRRGRLVPHAVRDLVGPPLRAAAPPGDRRSGARPVAIDAESHDRLLAAVSHLPHVLANVLVAQAAGRGELPRVGPSFRDATRVAGANSAIWTDIYLANREAIADEIDAAVERLREAAGDAARRGARQR